MLNSKVATKINYDVTVISTTKLKKNKVQSGLIQTYF